MILSYTAAQHAMASPGKTRLAATLCAFALVFFLFVQPAAATGNQAKIKVLIVDGFSNHDWRQTTALLRGILEPSDLFTVSVSTAPPTAASPGWEQWRPKFRLLLRSSFRTAAGLWFSTPATMHFRTGPRTTG